MKTAAALLAIAALGAGHALAQDASAAVVRVVVTRDDGVRPGSGVLVEADGTILATSDQLRGARSVAVVLPGGQTRDQVRLLLSNERWNVAVLKVDGGGLPVAPRGSSEVVRPGDSVTALSAAEVGRVAGQVRGRRQFGGYHWFDLSMVVPREAAGGAVVNARGELVGILVVQGRAGRERVFAVPIAYAEDLLPRARQQGGRLLADSAAGSSGPVALNPAARDSQRLAALELLQPDSPVLLRVRDAGRLAGPLVRRDSLWLVVGPFIGYAESDTAVAIARIDSLWTRGNQSRLYGAIGAGAGLILGTVLTSTRTSTSGPPGAGSVIAGALGGLAVGGGGGWLIGSLMPRWRLSFPSPRRR